MKLREHTLPTKCPNCGKDNPIASNAYGDEGQALPGEGDVSFCIGCGAVSIFAEDAPGGARKPTESEQASLDDDPRIERLKRAWEAVQRAGRGW